MSLVQGDASLRKIAERDLSLILEWRNSPRIRSCMYSEHLITWEEHVGWFERHVQSGRAIPYIFELNGVPAGLLQFTNLERSSSRCHWGFYLGREDLPKGTGLIMGQLGLQMAFDELNFNKVCGEVFHYNIPSIRFHQKLGFSHEGTFVRHLVKNEQYIDVLHFAKFREQEESGEDDGKLSSR